jgi:hypothetical protein
MDDSKQAGQDNFDGVRCLFVEGVDTSHADGFEEYFCARYEDCNQVKCMQVLKTGRWVLNDDYC